MCLYLFTYSDAITYKDETEWWLAVIKGFESAKSKKSSLPKGEGNLFVIVGPSRRHSGKGL
jgi:hypothetical protein